MKSAPPPRFDPWKIACAFPYPRSDPESLPEPDLPQDIVGLPKWAPGQLPPIAYQNAAASGTDVAGYLTQSPAVTVFTLHDGTVYQTYATTWRGLEFLMGYYPILDHAPNGRAEGPDDWQLWLRRHDEY